VSGGVIRRFCAGHPDTYGEGLFQHARKSPMISATNGFSRSTVPGLTGFRRESKANYRVTLCFSTQVRSAVGRPRMVSVLVFRQRLPHRRRGDGSTIDAGPSQGDSEDHRPQLAGNGSFCSRDTECLSGFCNYVVVTRHLRSARSPESRVLRVQFAMLHWPFRQVFDVGLEWAVGDSGSYEPVAGAYEFVVDDLSFTELPEPGSRVARSTRARFQVGRTRAQPPSRQTTLRVLLPRTNARDC